MWIYETGVETPEVLGSGSNFSSVITTSDKDKAFTAFAENGRNYLIRYRKEEGRKVDMEEYWPDSKLWKKL